MTATRLVVNGRVQGVFYRDWTVETAQALGLAGWVRNLPDGTVEAHLEGPVETVRTMIEQMHGGPPRAEVTRIERRDAEREDLSAFERR